MIVYGLIVFAMQKQSLLQEPAQHSKAIKLLANLIDLVAQILEEP